MVNRKKIGLIFSNNENWIGGTYYILNVVHALNILNDSFKPFIYVITKTEKEFDYLKTETLYPHLEFVQLEEEFFQLSVFSRICNKLYLLFQHEYTFSKSRLLNIDRDLKVFPYFSGGLQNDVAWIPDFQDKHLPHFFNENELKNRFFSHRRMAKYSRKIVFSSQNALQDFRVLFPHSKVNISVIPFAVTLNNKFYNLDLKSITEKYKIDRKYFIIPNQFWKHKNHLLVLKAIINLKNVGKDILVVFTGKEYDYRNPEYFNELKEYVSENNIQDNVRFLGFIDRDEQLLLVNNALALIQPSLFEGWSTSIEDAKALNKFVLASDLPIHREQLTKNCFFFDVEDHIELSELLFNYRDYPEISKDDYSINIKQFGENILSVLT